VNPLVPIGAVTLLIGHGGTGKSLFALKMAIHIALGLEIIGAKTSGEKVAYLSLEDSEDIVRDRMFKIFKALPEKQQRIDELTNDKIMILDRYGLPTYMAEKNYGNITTPPFVKSLSLLLNEHKIKCLFVDTFIRTNPLNENDNAEMGRLLVTYEGLAQKAECGVVLIHHLPKVSLNKSYSARGASAITDNARSALLMQIVPKDKAKNIKNEDIKTAIGEERLISVTHTKHNYSTEHPNRYLMMTKDGIFKEISSASLPVSDPASTDPEPDSVIKQLYKQLYDWWVNVRESKPLARGNINDTNAKIIRKSSTRGPGKERFKEALDWAVENKYAELTSPPKDGSNNSNTKYYTLNPLKEHKKYEEYENTAGEDWGADEALEGDDYVISEEEIEALIEQQNEYVLTNEEVDALIELEQQANEYGGISEEEIEALDEYVMTDEEIESMIEDERESDEFEHEFDEPLDGDDDE
jgi:hypothetical protein